MPSEREIRWAEQDISDWDKIKELEMFGPGLEEVRMGPLVPDLIVDDGPTDERWEHEQAEAFNRSMMTDAYVLHMGGSND